MAQGAAARLLAGTSQSAHLTPTLRQLHWLPGSLWIQFKVWVLAFKALKGLGPSY